MHRVVIAVGSNINPAENVKQAAEILRTEHGLLGESRFVTTKPVGYQDQDDFLNGAFLIESPLSFDELNAYLKQVEKRLGRVKGPIKSGPRTIDLDIIIWNNEIVDDDFFTQSYIAGPVREIIETFNIPVQNRRNKKS